MNDSSLATQAGLKRFGEWVRAHRENQLLWSYDLRSWFDERYGFSSAQKLTQKIFMDYLADRTKEEKYRCDSKPNDLGYLNQLKTVEGWANLKPDKIRAASINQYLLDALARVRFLSFGPTKASEIDKNRFYVNNPIFFTDVMAGRIDPFSPITQIIVVDQLGYLINGITLGTSLKSIYDMKTLREFASDQWQESDLERRTGRLYGLIHGEVSEVKESDLVKLCKSIEGWLKKYESSESKFDQEDLLNAISRKGNANDDTILETAVKLS